MTCINKRLLERTLVPMLGLLFMLTAVTVSEGRVRRNTPTPATPRQESTMRGTFLKAERVGRTDGLRAGRQDRKRGEPSNFRDEAAYQKGTRGYSPKMGDKASYQQHYRQGFENGYDAGYNGY